MIGRDRKRGRNLPIGEAGIPSTSDKSPISAFVARFSRTEMEGLVSALDDLFPRYSEGSATSAIQKLDEQGSTIEELRAILEARRRLQLAD